MKLEIPSGNFILGNEPDIEKVKHCPICGDKLFYIEVLKALKCCNCSYTIKIKDSKPKSKLASTGDSNTDILVQPDKVRGQEPSDIPRRFKEVKQTDLNYKWPI